MSLSTAAARLQLLRKLILWLWSLGGIVAFVSTAYAVFEIQFQETEPFLAFFAGLLGLGVGFGLAFLAVIPIDALEALCDAADGNVGSHRTLRDRFDRLVEQLADDDDDE